jgi:hypothetical protein
VPRTPDKQGPGGRSPEVRGGGVALLKNAFQKVSLDRPEQLLGPLRSSTSVSYAKKVTSLFLNFLSILFGPYQTLEE